MASPSDVQNNQKKERENASSGQASDIEQELWRRFTGSTTSTAFYENWLSLQCHILGAVDAGILLLGPPDHGPFTPAAVWPDQSVDVTHLAAPAEQALKERRGLLVNHNGAGSNTGKETKGEGWYVAYPIEMAGRMHGVVVLDLPLVSSHEVQDTIRKLHWGASWIQFMVLQVEGRKAEEALSRFQMLLDSVAIAGEHRRFKETAMAFVTRLATTLECDRVSLGFVEDKQAKVEALSHSAGFGKQMNLMAVIASAMDEAVDQGSVIVYPAPAETTPLATLAHAELARSYGSPSICTVPLVEQGKATAVLTLERAGANPFDESAVETIKTLALLVAPIFSSRRREERRIWTKLWEACQEQLRNFTGPEHPGLKLAAVVVALITLFFVFVKGEHRVKAPTLLEGVVQRAIAAPFSGYVAEAPARPGDLVRQRDLLCRLDDRELKLERLKWATQREQLYRQYGEAMAKHERAQVMITEAKMDQAEAQVALLDEQLARSRILAPFDGIVTSGDLSQLLGTPVERGQSLFEIAPLKGYRVIVQVDERDIGYVTVGQRGHLVLPSVPGTRFRFTVSKVTPVSTAKEGRNYFRVEAQLENVSPSLRPGMEGVGKIATERRRLIWIWTHEAVEWICLKLWSWWP